MRAVTVGTSRTGQRMSSGALRARADRVRVGTVIEASVTPEVAAAYALQPLVCEPSRRRHAYALPGWYVVSSGNWIVVCARAPQG